MKLGRWEKEVVKEVIEEEVFGEEEDGFWEIEGDGDGFWS